MDVAPQPVHDPDHDPGRPAARSAPEPDHAVELRVYTATGCCLCDEARADLDRLAPELGLAVEWVAIDGDEALERRWRERIPAGVIGDRMVFKYRVEPEMLRRRVAETRGERRNVPCGMLS